MRQSARVKTFEVGYKGYYHEHSEWYTDYIEAEDEGHALAKFAKEHRFKLVAHGETGNCRWEEGEWFMAFQYIKEVKIQPCDRCRGTGVVAV